MQDQNRKFKEQFHEREVLRPILLLLIGIADRCRDQQAAFGKKAKGCAAPEVAEAWVCAKAARIADRTEIENVLAILGVTPLRSESAKFDASTQHAVRHVPTSNPTYGGHVAARLRPGYGRNGHVVRSEMVSVYVVREPSAPHTQGEMTHARDGHRNV